MSGRGIRRSGMRAMGVLAMVMAAGWLLAGCSKLPFGTDAPVSSVTESQDAGGDVDFDANVGDCVYLSGSTFDAKIDHATCGKSPANYKVVAKSPNKSACPTDADQTYYVTLNGKEQGALCLDIDWKINGCMTVPSFGEPAHVPCTSTDSDAKRILKIIPGAVDESNCPEATTNYYTYDERKKVVCVASLD